jgi:hypothetical protein
MKDMIKEHEMLPLLEKFIKQNQNNRRRKRNGASINEKSGINYEMLYRVLVKYTTETGFVLKVYEINKANEREKKKVQKYWNLLYSTLTDYLYNKQNYTDNYVGQNIKLLKAFLNWLVIERDIVIGQYYKKFYVPYESIPIVVLEPEMLNYLIYSKEFESSLSDTLSTTKDLFVFGCTVGLRFSDLRRLTVHNLEQINHRTYLAVMSNKTQTLTRVMLPEYAMGIIHKYKARKQKRLLPYPLLTPFNIQLKQLAEQAGWNYIVPKIRMKRGKPIEMKTKNSKQYRFCDLISSHCMRRTAVTTMLRLGLEENLVRKISGHSPGSKEFYKYVQLSQSYMDEELSKIHEKISQNMLLLTKNQAFGNN